MWLDFVEPAVEKFSYASGLALDMARLDLGDELVERGLGFSLSTGEVPGDPLGLSVGVAADEDAKAPLTAALASPFSDGTTQFLTTPRLLTKLLTKPLI